MLASGPTGYNATPSGSRRSAAVLKQARPRGVDPKDEAQVVMPEHPTPVPERAGQISAATGSWVASRPTSEPGSCRSWCRAF